jgi:hypothetical protein
MLSLVFREDERGGYLFVGERDHKTGIYEGHDYGLQSPPRLYTRSELDKLKSCGCSVIVYYRGGIPIPM